VLTGCILDILTPADFDGSSIATIDCFEVGALHHLIFDMPTLSRRHGEKTTLIIPINVCDVFIEYISY
jgi:hypothetical protein